MVRMSTAATEAAKALSRARWGSQRVDKLAAEVVARADELSIAARAQLRAEFGADRTDTTQEIRYR
jgi:hypothetical protein